MVLIFDEDDTNITGLREIWNNADMCIEVVLLSSELKRVDEALRNCAVYGARASAGARVHGRTNGATTGRESRCGVA